MKPYLVLMRPHHYIKNLLILLPLFFSGAIFQRELWAGLIWGFASLSFLSSFIYIINDVCDVEKDRQHEKKCRRPLAAGQIKIKTAVGFALMILVLAIIMSLMAANKGASWPSLIFFLAYLLINLLYSFKFKNIPIIDVALIASGFLIRVLYGGALTGIDISGWLYLMVLATSFYMGFGKRRNEMRRVDFEKSRKVLSAYDYNFLDKNMHLCLGISIVFYSLWALEGVGPLLIWTVPLLMLIFFRYSLLIESGTDGDPTGVLLSDKFLIILVLMFLGILAALIYGPRLSDCLF